MPGVDHIVSIEKFPALVIDQAGVVVPSVKEISIPPRVPVDWYCRKNSRSLARIEYPFRPPALGKAKRDH